MFGATAWQRVRHVTVPLLKASLQVALIIRTILAFQAFAVGIALAAYNMPALAGRDVQLVQRPAQSERRRGLRAVDHAVLAGQHRHLPARPARTRRGSGEGSRWRSVRRPLGPRGNLTTERHGARVSRRRDRRRGSPPSRSLAALPAGRPADPVPALPDLPHSPPRSARGLPCSRSPKSLLPTEITFDTLLFFLNSRGVLLHLEQRRGRPDHARAVAGDRRPRPATRLPDSCSAAATPSGC